MSLQSALAALLLRGPAHGYELLSVLQAELGETWEIRPSNAYLTFGRMERDGLIQTQRIEQLRHPDRKLLVLTSTGRRHADEWLFSPAPAHEIVVKLAIARIVVPDQFEEIAKSIAADRAANLRQLRQLRDASRGGFQPETLGAEIARTESELRWASSIRDRASEIVARHGVVLPQGLARRRRSVG